MKTYLTKDNKQITIRRPNEADAERVISYAKILFASTDQVLTTPEEYKITVGEEKSWIKSFKNNPNSIILIAESGGEVIGLLDFTAKSRKKVAHSGEFGVSVHPDYQGKGIGKAMIETLLQWAESNTQIEKVALQVFATNAHAIKLYKALGFQEEGRHIKAIRQPSGVYVDLIQMYIETKNK